MSTYFSALSFSGSGCYHSFSLAFSLLSLSGCHLTPFLSLWLSFFVSSFLVTHTHILSSFVNFSLIFSFTFNYKMILKFLVLPRNSSSKWVEPRPFLHSLLKFLYIIFLLFVLSFPLYTHT